ncbi:hypothetical protein B7494_g7383 [Chlorociboria aeruginascens]|nr:hypothetical protein B7494_g7383 [Chlorociboria aeruginascens]
MQVVCLEILDWPFHSKSYEPEDVIPSKDEVETRALTVLATAVPGDTISQDIEQRNAEIAIQERQVDTPDVDLPLLCAYPGTCDTGYTCVKTNNPAGSACCGFNELNIAVCFQVQFCPGTFCTSSLQCGLLSACIYNTCCGGNVCVPISSACPTLALKEKRDELYIRGGGDTIGDNISKREGGKLTTVGEAIAIDSI